MEAVELLDRIALGETSTVQFKRTMDNPDKIAAELCAFANSSGGMILFGVEDNGTVTGLQPSEVREISSRVANIAADLIREPVFPTSEAVKLEDKIVLVVHVSESQSKPHFDSNGRIWVKTMGDKRRVTSREELRRIFQDAHVFYADEQVVLRSSLSDLNGDAFDAFYRHEFGVPRETETPALALLLENLNLAREGALTLAGLLFFGNAPQRFRLPNALTVGQVKAGNSIPRNPILHGLASKLMPYRGIGTGIRRALKLYPHIELYNDVEENRFRVVIGTP